jgi:hypothetical protein
MTYKLKCSCTWVAEHWGKIWKSHHIMHDTTAKNGINCDFCGYETYKDWGDQKYENIVPPTYESQRGKYEKPKKRRPVSSWHKIDKSE